MKAYLSGILAVGVLLAAFASPALAHARFHHQVQGHTRHQPSIAIRGTHLRAGYRHHHLARGHSPRYAHVAWSDRLDRHAAASGGGASESRGCLTGQTRALLDRVEAQFGRVQIVSTCRPGAVIAGTNHASMHRYGRAVDFVAPNRRKAEIVHWLAANNPGGTMTYAHMNHIHMDTGPYHFVSLGSPSAGGGWHPHHARVLARAQTFGRAYGFAHAHTHTYAYVRTFDRGATSHARGGYGMQLASHHAVRKFNRRY